MILTFASTLFLSAIVAAVLYLFINITKINYRHSSWFFGHLRVDLLVVNSTTEKKSQGSARRSIIEKFIMK
jgi:hypothetical protein